VALLVARIAYAVSSPVDMFRQRRGGVLDQLKGRSSALRQQKSLRTADVYL